MNSIELERTLPKVIHDLVDQLTNRSQFPVNRIPDTLLKMYQFDVGLRIASGGFIKKSAAFTKSAISNNGAYGNARDLMINAFEPIYTFGLGNVLGRMTLQPSFMLADTMPRHPDPGFGPIINITVSGHRTITVYGDDKITHSMEPGMISVIPSSVVDLGYSVGNIRQYRCDPTPHSVDSVDNSAINLNIAMFGESVSSNRDLS